MDPFFGEASAGSILASVGNVTLATGPDFDARPKDISFACVLVVNFEVL